MADSTSRLPARPLLEQLSKQAEELQPIYRAGETPAVERFHTLSRFGRSVAVMEPVILPHGATL